MDTKRVLIAAAAAAAAALSFDAWAAGLRPTGAFVEGAVAEHPAYSVTAGLLWPWSWRRDFGSMELTGLTEAYVSHWSAKGADRRQTYTQLGVVPLLRLRFDGGRSAWFIEGGIGASIMDRVYHTPDRQFSTTFNFVDVAGLGRSFGPGRRHELSLRFSHVSNAGIKQPNPGENFLQLRYAVMF